MNSETLPRVVVVPNVVDVVIFDVLPLLGIDDLAADADVVDTDVVDFGGDGRASENGARKKSGTAKKMSRKRTLQNLSDFEPKKSKKKIPNLLFKLFSPKIPTPIEKLKLTKIKNI